MKMKRGDKFVVALTSAVFILSIISICYYFLGQAEGSKSLKAEIYEDGNIVKTIDLNNVKEPYTFTIGNEGHCNVVSVEKGRIRFSDADCKDHICVKTGWLTKKGEMAVCLPHKVYIKIIGNDEIDGATY